MVAKLSRGPVLMPPVGGIFLKFSHYRRTGLNQTA
jgi:hypothetical protein